jgi:hypothetical protein
MRPSTTASNKLGLREIGERELAPAFTVDELRRL